MFFVLCYNSLMHLRRVGILCGGDVDFHNHSISLGAKALEHFFENLYPKYKPFDIFLDKENNWHLNGLYISPSDLSHQIDFVWNLSHPNFNIILKNFGIPVIGLSAFNFALSSNRNLFQEHLKNSKINFTRHLVLPVFQKDFDKDEKLFSLRKAKEVFEKFASPWFVYPFSREKNYSPFLAKTFPELVFAIEEGTKHKIPLVVEEFISHKEAEVHSFTNFRNQDLYSLNSLAKEFSKDQKEIIHIFNQEVLNVFPLSFYSKTNIVLDKKNKPFVRSVDFMLDLSEDSVLNKTKDDFGISLRELFESMMHHKNML